MTKGIELQGGGVDADGQNVTVHAPTPDLRNQAMVSNPRTDALLIGRDTPIAEAACFRCKGLDIVVKVKFPRDEGYQLALCRDCLKDRPPGRPILIDMEFVD